MKRKVVRGTGMVTSVPAILYTKDKRTQSKRVLRVLLDSGSDGDLLFVKEGDKSPIPFKERFRPQKWRTSNGTFETSKVGKVELIFPEFSDSKMATFKPDVVQVPKESPPPVYDLIIGVQSLIKIGAILDFHKCQLTIDQISLPMRPHDQLMDLKDLHAQLSEHLEPASTRDATTRTVKILDAKYEKADLASTVAQNCKHLTVRQQNMLLTLLTEYEILFDGTLGDWQTKPVGFQLKEGAKPYHGRAFPIPRIHLETLKKEVRRLEELGVLKRQPDSEWASPTFIIPKKNKTVRFLSDFREVNKRIVRKPFPIPKLSTPYYKKWMDLPMHQP